MYAINLFECMYDTWARAAMALQQGGADFMFCPRAQNTQATPLTPILTHLTIHPPNLNDNHRQGRRPGGTGGTAPQNLRWGGRPMHWSPPIFREVVLSDVCERTNRVKKLSY